MANRVIEAVLRLSARLGNMAAFGRLSDNLARVEDRAKRFNRAQGVIGDGARAMHATLMRYAAPAALTYGAAQAFTDFAELERRMTRIGITATATAEETQDAWRRAQDFADDYAMPLDAVIEGLDTLVASGRTLEEAMAFLPSVLRTAQASGAATSDIANTAEKSASALKITADGMQRAFDIMVEGGKAGQFELRDMAMYVPELANSFASLGYQGEDGLKRLVSVLQTIREDTGSASAAATQAQNIFGKMFTEETANKFGDFGIDIRRELEAARDAGEGMVEAFVRISRQAIDGDLSKLPLLFTDQEFRLGMQSLITSADSYERFLAVVNSSEVDGSVLRDFNRVLGDSQAKIDRMANSWKELKTTLGSAIAPMVGGGMDFVTEEVRKGQAVNAALDKTGMTEWEKSLWRARSNFRPDMRDGMAWRGGYRSDEERRMIAAYGDYGRSRSDPSALPPRPAAPPGDGGGATISPKVSRFSGYRPFAAGGSPRDAERSSMAALTSNPNEIADAIDEALAEGSRRAVDTLAQGAPAAGEDLGATANARLQEGASQAGAAMADTFLSKVRAGLGSILTSARGVNANLGRTDVEAEGGG